MSSLVWWSGVKLNWLPNFNREMYSISSGRERAVMGNLMVVGVWATKKRPKMAASVSVEWAIKAQCCLAVFIFLRDTFTGKFLCSLKLGWGHLGSSDFSIFRCFLTFQRWCGDVEPHMGIDLILYGPVSIRVHHTQIVLGRGIPLLSRKFVPPHRGLIILRNTAKMSRPAINQPWALCAIKSRQPDIHI